MVKQKYFLEIAFDGTQYHGWQIQSNKKTVQGTITSILSKLYNEEIKIVGCGRTDSGVHAKQYFFHFETNKERKKLFDSIKIMFPKDINLLKIHEVDSDCHTRYDATERSYTYYLHQKKNIFKQYYSLGENLKDLNIEEITKACKLFTQEDNYKQLSKNNPKLNSYTSKVINAEWQISKDKTEATFQVTSNRFLHNQIRRMVGVLLNIGIEKTSVSELEQAMKEDLILRLNDSVPPHALFLHSIKYPYI